MTGWQPDGKGVQSGNEVGGDGQATDGFSVRYIHRDRRPPAMVTVYFFGDDLRRGDETLLPRYGVTRMTELMVCRDLTDPGGTEEWCDYRYDYLDAPDSAIPASWRSSVHGQEGVVAWPSIAEAERAARESAARHTAEHIVWDGCSPWA